MAFSDKVQRLLDLRGLSQGDLAERMGTTQPQISRWLSDDRPPGKSKHLIGMAQALECSVEFLVDDEATWPPPELSPDEVWLLKLVHKHGLTAEEAIDAVIAWAKAGRAKGPPEGHGDPPRPVAVPATTVITRPTPRKLAN